jgi:hypothetical protein
MSQNDVNQHLMAQNEHLNKEIAELKMMVSNLTTQISTSLGSLSHTVIGKVDSIHRTFKAAPPAPAPPVTATATAKATTNPQQPKKNKGKGKATENAPAPPPPPPPPAPKTWATVTKNGKPEKAKTTTPTTSTPELTKNMIVQRSGGQKDDDLNLLILRNTINKELLTAKAPESLQISGISWNLKANLLLYTRDGFTSTDFDLHKATIETVVKNSDQNALFLCKQESWYKIAIHGVPIMDYPDDHTGMNDLQAELEYQNTDLILAASPRYMTHPDKRNGKSHSSVMIAITSKSMYNKLIKNGILIFGQRHRTGAYLTARPGDQCSNCQKFGHKFQRCPSSKPVCAFCGHDHATNKHFCGSCRATDSCAHIPPKCINCGEQHKATDRSCAARPDPSRAEKDIMVDQ